MLGPLLFSLYINDLKHILKIEGGDDPHNDKDDKLQHFFFRPTISRFICGQSFINLREVSLL